MMSHISQKKLGGISGVKIFVERAEDLQNNNINPFVTVRIGEKQRKDTEVKKKSSSPEWREFVFFQTPFQKSELILEVYDKSGITLFSTKKLLGFVQVDLSELFDGETRDYKLPLLRAPSGTISFSIEAMNYGKERIKDLEAMGLEEEIPTTIPDKKAIGDSIYMPDKSFEKSPAELMKEKSNSGTNSGNNSFKESKKTFEHPKMDKVVEKYVDVKMYSLYENNSTSGSSGSGKKKTIEEEMMEGGDVSEIEVSTKDKESRYKEGEKIGKGGMGTVYLATDTRTGTTIALKKVSLDGGTSLNQALKEVTPIQGLKHPNLAKYLDYFVTKDLSKLCLVMDYYKDGDLEHYLEKVKESGKPLPEDQLLNIMLQLASGVGYLHKNGLLHRDLKPGNIFMADNFKTMKIGDFGLMKDVSQSIGQTFAGTQKYMAPEYYENAKTFGTPSDVWSLGVVFYELCILELKNLMYLELFKQQQLSFNKSIIKDIRKHYSQKVADIVIQMLQKNPDDRPSCIEVAEMIEGKRATQLSSNGPINKNLLYNTQGEDGHLNRWTLTSNKGNGWGLEDGEMADGKKGGVFVTSSDWCIREQTLDLMSLGFSEDFLDSEPDVIISDWYKSREDIPSSFMINVVLMDGAKNEIASFRQDSINTAPNWAQITNTFKSYGPNLKFIKFIDGGKDVNQQKGHYGAMISQSSVILIPISDSSFVEKRETIQKSWMKMVMSGTVPKERSAFTLNPYGESYFLVGGCDDKSYFQEFYEFLTTTSSWSLLPSPRFLRRSHHAAAVHKDFLYILGGCRKLGYLRGFHQYDFVTKKWTELESLPGAARRGHACVVYQDNLFVFGGFDGTNFLNDLWKYSFADKKWDFIKTVGDISGRESFTMVNYKDEFLVFGGLTINQQSNELFSLNLLNQTWTKLVPSGHSIKPRAFHSGAIKENRLYLFGGHDSSGWSDDFEFYDIETNLFTSIESIGHAPSKRAGASMFERDGNFILAGGHSSPKYYMDLHISK